jgi:hypothetical protein
VGFYPLERQFISWDVIFVRWVRFSTEMPLKLPFPTFQLPFSRIANPMFGLEKLPISS